MKTTTGLNANTTVNTMPATKAYATINFSAYDCQVIEVSRFTHLEDSLEFTSTCARSEAEYLCESNALVKHKFRYTLEPSGSSANDWQLWQSIRIPAECRYLLAKVALHNKAIEQVFGYEKLEDACSKIQVKSFNAYYDLNESTGDCSLVQYNHRAFVSSESEGKSWVWQIVKIS